MEDYITLYAVSPYKIVQQVKRKSSWFNRVKNLEKKEVKNLEKKEVKKLEKKWHKFEISANSQRNLKKKIEYLFAFAKEKKVKSRNNKMFKYKVAFITLTLSYEQSDSTARIVEKIFQPFLDRCRKLYGMNNYVYRLEHQTNGNVHFHLVTDCYIDYYDLKKVWNECQEYLGYITMFKNQMASLKWIDYKKKYLKKNNYKKCYENWKLAQNRELEPNSVDVKVAKENTNIQNYIAKYFSKKEGAKKMNDLDNEENSFGLRLCFWSRSLSKCKSYLMPNEYYPFNHIWNNIRERIGVTEKWFDYVKVLYINNKKIDWGFRLIWRRFWQHFKEEWSYQEWKGNECKWVIN